MKRLVALLLCLGLCGCAIAYSNRMSNVRLGMSKDEVMQAIGHPASISATEGVEYLNYRLSETADEAVLYGITHDYSVCIKNGKVVSYGKRGDFGTTEQPAQVIKISGGLQSDENIKIQSTDELTTKIKTINKLLSDGLITKMDFEERKKKLLDEYTSR